MSGVSVTDARERRRGRFAEDLTGRTFGLLTVTQRSPVSGHRGEARWVCRCACGALTVVMGKHLRSGAIVSCGCAGAAARAEQAERRARQARHDVSAMIGQTFGRLAVARVSDVVRGRDRLLECVCACGRTALAVARKLRSGAAVTCGCGRAERLALGHVALAERRASRHAAGPAPKAGAPAPVAEPIAEPNIPPPPPSTSRTSPRMLPMYAETVAHRCDRTPQHDERTRANAVARAWGVERRDDCTSYDDCLGRVPMVALDARCPRVCPGYVATVRRVEGYGGWRTTD